MTPLERSLRIDQKQDSPKKILVLSRVDSDSTATEEPEVSSSWLTTEILPCSNAEKAYLCPFPFSHFVTRSQVAQMALNLLTLNLGAPCLYLRRAEII